MKWSSADLLFFRLDPAEHILNIRHALFLDQEEIANGILNPMAYNSVILVGRTA